MRKIALFGTSADPPTAGHQAILSWLSQRFDGVAVWAANNPFKSHQTPLEHRSKMLRLLIEETYSSRQNIHLYPELSSPRTLETVEKAREIWGASSEFTLVIGSDLVYRNSQESPQVKDSGLPIQRWYRVEDLLQQVQLLVIPRPGYPIEEAGLDQLRQLGTQISVADLTAPAVSSTAYRENGDTEALTTTVEDYIHQEHLYACQDAVQSR